MDKIVSRQYYEDLLKKVNMGREISLSNHAEMWWWENGHDEIPDKYGKAWMDMYQEWVEYAFDLKDKERNPYAITQLLDTLNRPIEYFNFREGTLILKVDHQANKTFLQVNNASSSTYAQINLTIEEAKVLYNELKKQLFD